MPAPNPLRDARCPFGAFHSTCMMDARNSIRRLIRVLLWGMMLADGATGTDFGASVIHRYRSMERATRRAIAKDLAALERNLRPAPRRTRR